MCMAEAQPLCMVQVLGCPPSQSSIRRRQAPHIGCQRKVCINFIINNSNHHIVYLYSDWAVELSNDIPVIKRNMDTVYLSILTHLKHYFSLPLCLIFVEDSDQESRLDTDIPVILGAMKALVKLFGFSWHTVCISYTLSFYSYNLSSLGTKTCSYRTGRNE